MEASFTYDPDKVIRKLRKKLRQIDHLELLERELNEEEVYKKAYCEHVWHLVGAVSLYQVNQKLTIRKQLQDLLKQHHPDEIEIMKRPSSILPQSKNDAKKVKKSSSSDSCQKTLSDAQETETAASSEPLQPDSSQVQYSPLQTLDKDQPKTETEPGTSRKSNKNPRDGQTHTEGKCMWRDGYFEVHTLQGHNDIVLAVDYLEDYILSASRDTTVRVWRVGSTEEERNLRGHTASVTSVSFLPKTLAASVIARCEADSEEFASRQETVSSDSGILAVSGGLDCTLKVWNVISGENLSSIYTYNGITCLGCGSWGVATGTEGGRLEFWCLTSHQRITFIDAFESQVTTVHVCKNDVYAGSWEGELGVWQLNPTRKTLSTKYIMERESSPSISLRQLSALVEHKGKCYLGDGGPNIKVLDWKRSQVSRLKNHRGDVGMTDSLAVTQDGCLLAASFLVDSGCPSINIRDLQSGKYLVSLIDQDEGRYLTLSAASNIVIAGGHLLKVWIHREKSVPPKNKMPSSTYEVVLPVFLHKLATPAVDSGSEEDTDWASSSEEEDDSRQSSKKRNQGETGSQWWCSVL